MDPNYFSILKNKILEGNISDKFRNYAEKLIFIPTFLENKRDIHHKEYFLSKNIDLQDIVPFRLNNIVHKDYSIRFGLTRGFIAIYPDTISKDIDIVKDMKERYEILVSKKFMDDDMLYLPFLDLFMIAIYIRTWMWHGRGIEYSKYIYYNKRTKELYGCTPSMDEVLPIILEKKEYDLNYYVEYITNAFNTTINYDENYLINELIMIPITGMHEALILNDSVLDGYKYDREDSATIS